MKIVFTTHAYWPKKNGVQYVNQYLAEGLVGLGHNVTVITSHTDSKEEECYEHNGVKIIDLYLETKYSFLYFGRRDYCRRVLELIEDSDFLINVCVQAPNNNVLLPLLKKIKCKKILYMHGMHDFKHVGLSDSGMRYYFWHMFMNARWWVFYSINKTNFQKYDCMIDIHETSSAISFMKKKGYSKEILVINNAVQSFDNVDIEKDDIGRLKFIEGDYFLNVANFTELKNQEMIIKSYFQIKDKTSYNVVLIGGSSNYSKHIKKLITDYKLTDRVLVLEDFNREDTIKYIKNAKCGIVSSKKEVYPIFIGEIISCKHPYISTDVGCIKSIPGGLIVNNCEEMANAMLEIENGTISAELIDRGYKYAMSSLRQNTKVSQLVNILTRL